MEKSGYRDNIEMLNARFPDKDMLNKRETAAVLGVALNTAKRHIRFNSMGMVSKADLARQISV